MIKKIKFYLECIKIVWKDRHSKNCRQKRRRLLREIEKLNKQMGLYELKED
ncbi:hypothetical protein ACR77J_16455 [Tissierella praeacuta]|uniref:hypothetical protein n=1 Tax=Tissierella praeacuta TaxID=43131 RepID=UPI003DA50564